ncbi:YfkD family protein [Virgibacillus soli]|uniref:YfkD famly protein n=1 Tax=Paracerasibacillus soli TaxID=480284 RepID=UPI0035EFAC7C
MNKAIRFSLIFLLIMFSFISLSPTTGLAKEKKTKKTDISIPEHVISISKENTYPNASEDQEEVEPSALTKELLQELDISVKNPDLIKMLNETTIKPSPIAIGYRGMVYLGRWPLHYKSLETTPNWEYQQINTNELNNLGGEATQKLSYNQDEQKEVKGALTSKINQSDQVKKMMLLEAKAKTKLPLSYHTVIGKGTKKTNYYNVPIKKFGYLHSYAPAINERGQVTFGEVYLQLKGSKKEIVIKNVTKQGIGAWIPIQDHLSFTFRLN